MPSPAPVPEALRALLLAWFDAHARDLPWRRSGDPYAIWVSEIMLQQTRVDTVVPYYGRWLERFPDVDALADASEEEVLKAWEGLGYYRRARALHRAAGVVRDRHGGRLPASADTLRELPGVGAYTAGAIASQAFGEAVPAVDGNVRRVLARLRDRAEPGAAWLRDTAAALVDPERPGDLNQALMELGATVCTPRAPRCGACPVAGACGALAAGTVEERPARRARPAPPTRSFGVAVVAADARVLLARRPSEGMLGGLWAFPEGRLEGEEPEVGAEVGARAAVAALGVEVADAPGRALPAVRHAYSHFTGVYHPVALEAGPGEPEGAVCDGVTWADAAELADLPLPRAQRTIADALPCTVPGWG